MYYTIIILKENKKKTKIKINKINKIKNKKYNTNKISKYIYY